MSEQTLAIGDRVRHRRGWFHGVGTVVSLSVTGKDAKVDTDCPSGSRYDTRGDWHRSYLLERVAEIAPATATEGAGAP